MTRGTLLLGLLAAAHAWAQPGSVIQVIVDARDAPRKLIHVHLTIPASPGPVTLLYPQWIPGEHGPTGPIADVVSLRFSAKDQAVAWRRDSTNLYAFHLNVPQGATALDATFDFISPTDAGGFSAGSSMTTELAVLSWNQYVFYPQGTAADQLQYQAKLRLPHEWHYGTALPVARQSGDDIEFRPVSLTTLVDSPVSTGAHYRTIELGTYDGAPHYMHIAADSERALAITPETVQHYRKLIAETGALFGARHYRGYHFLLTLSDHVASFGLEHHESSDDRLNERMLIDDVLLHYHSELLPHEYVHSWNGKYRRPAGLATKNYDEPMKGDLLWIYEGLTEYLGSILAARSGLETPDLFRERLAYVAAHLEHESGRGWRSLADTSISGQFLFDARSDYAALRRGLDFYGEGQLLWLEVDTLLRKLSHGTKSVDDFCRAFYGGTAGPSVSPYTLDDVISALNRVAPYDWAAFFRQRVDAVDTRAPLAGIENGGWKLTYDKTRSDYWNTAEDEEKVTDLMLSLGVSVKNDGLVADVALGSAAQKAGLAPGAKITTVDGRAFSPAVLHEAAASGEPIELMVRNGEYVGALRVDYSGGEKYPHLERQNGKPDLLADIVRSKVP
ncbi:MAG: M61 family peptidase [Acidobacteriota bacterium]|nr:M61 family peptidase [Acidobacteriota bacterium]